MYDPGGSPQAELRPGRLPTSRITTREAPHKQNYNREPTHKQNYDPGAGWLAGRLASGTTTRKPFLALGWLAGWAAGWLAAWLRPEERGQDRPREAQRVGAWIEQACHALCWRLPTRRFATREVRHRFLYVRRSPPDYQTEIHYRPRASPQAAREVPRKQNYVRPTYKQNYVQEAYPQAELPRGSWLAGWLVVLRPGSLRLAGWLRRPREARREAAREAQRGGARMEQACHAFGWKLPQADLRPGRLPTDFFTEPQRKPPRTMYYELGFQTEIHFKPSASPQAELCMFVCYACTTRRLPTSRITTGEVELRPGR